MKQLLEYVSSVNYEGIDFYLQLYLKDEALIKAKKSLIYSFKDIKVVEEYETLIKKDQFREFFRDFKNWYFKEETKNIYQIEDKKYGEKALTNSYVVKDVTKNIKNKKYKIYPSIEFEYIALNGQKFIYKMQRRGVSTILFITCQYNNDNHKEILDTLATIGNIKFQSYRIGFFKTISSEDFYKIFISKNIELRQINECVEYIDNVTSLSGIDYSSKYSEVLNDIDIRDWWNRIFIKQDIQYNSMGEDSLLFIIRELNRNGNSYLLMRNASYGVSHNVEKINKRPFIELLYCINNNCDIILRVVKYKDCPNVVLHVEAITDKKNLKLRKEKIEEFVNANSLADVKFKFKD